MLRLSTMVKTAVFAVTLLVGAQALQHYTPFMGQGHPPPVATQVDLSVILDKL
jgi:hypothetical protein